MSSSHLEYVQLLVLLSRFSMAGLATLDMDTL
jgi:hypothetical protein